ncbi:hypothetical protein BDR26DRAFT_865841 [Obelidium mucronatum]|nr:hypothetical protein BDR26DRAFT_865841 [Obelidium mucronatum]
MLLVGVVAVVFAAAATVLASSADWPQIQALHAKAQKAYNGGDYKNAAKLLLRLSKKVPQWDEGVQNLVYAQLLSDDLKGAIKTCVDGVKRFPDNGDLHALYCRSVGQALNNHLDYTGIKFPPTEEMINVCLRSVKLLPDDQYALQSLAFMLKLTFQYDASVETYELWLRKFGHLDAKNTISVKANIARTLMRAGKFPRAFDIMDDVMKNEGERNAGNLQTSSMIRAIGWPMDPLAWDLKRESLELTVDGFTMTGGKENDHPLCPPGKKWTIAYNYSEEAISNPTRVKVTPLNPKTAYASYGSPSDPIFIGHEIPEYPKVFHEKSINLIHLSNVFMSGHPGVVHGDCTLYTGSHHVNIDLQIFPSTDKNMQIITVNHPTVSIIQHQISNYYHWVSETLPKLLFLNDHILSKPEHANTKILLPVPGTAHVIEDTFAMKELEHLKDRIIYYETPNFKRYHFTKGLYLVDWIHPRDDTHGTWDKNAWGVYWAPRAAFERVVEFYHTALKSRNLFPVVSSSDSDGSIVYVSRKGKVRGFPNEAELLEYLKGRFGNKLKVHTGGESALEQVGIFVKAKVVVGNHGAGLSNWAYAADPKKTRLVMVPAEPQIDFCFGNMVAALGGKHYVVTQIPGAHYFGDFQPITREGMKVLGDAVETAWNDVLETHDEL